MHLTPITMEEFLTNLYRFVISFQLHSCSYLKYEHFALSSSQQGKMTYRISFTDLYKSIDRTNLLASQFKNSNEPKSTAFPQRLQVKYFFKILFRRAPWDELGPTPLMLRSPTSSTRRTMTPDTWTSRWGSPRQLHNWGFFYSFTFQGILHSHDGEESG